jgi:hypothetical protein
MINHAKEASVAKTSPIELSAGMIEYEDSGGASPRTRPVLAEGRLA